MIPRLNPKALAKGFIKGFAPDFIAGSLEGQAKGKTTAQFYEYMDRGIWNSLSAGERRFLINQKPWNLDWFTLKFILEAIAKSNANLAYLVISSPELQTKIQAEIDLIKRELS